MLLLFVNSVTKTMLLAQMNAMACLLSVCLGKRDMILRMTSPKDMILRMTSPKDMILPMDQSTVLVTDFQNSIETTCHVTLMFL